jgi:aspartate/glutamate racemase
MGGERPLIFQGGHSFYGHVLGVMLFESTTPRIPGDGGNALTFNYPVLYEVVKGRFSDLIDGSDEIKDSLIKSAQNLERQGVKAIIGDCGLMSLYQKEVSASISIPFISSSLLQLPLIWRLLGCKGAIGIITGHSDYLKSHHLAACGAKEIPVVIQGMERKEEFARVVLKGSNSLNLDRMKRDVLEAAVDLMDKSSEIRAILLECTNLCSFARDVKKHTGVYVFDLISAVRMLEYSLRPFDFNKAIEKYKLL